MARTGWSTSNFLRYPSAILSAYPLTMAAWWWPTINTGGAALQSVLSVLNSTGADNINQFKIGQSNGGVSFLAADSVSSNSATTGVNSTLNTWNHLCGVGTSATDRAMFLNGANKATNATSRAPSGLDRVSAGKQDNAANNKVCDNASIIAECAIWNVALSDTEVAYLASGISPKAIQSAALVAYWPMIGDWNPENDLIAGQNFTINGTLSRTTHPNLPPYYIGQASILVHPGRGPSNRGRFLRTVGGGATPLGTASLSVTLADATLASAAKLAIAGTLSQTLANATLSSAATVKIVGALAVTLAHATLSSAAAVQIKAALARTLADASLSSAAQLEIQAVLAATLDDATLASIAQSIIHGNLGVTLEDAVLVATGNDGWTRFSDADGAWSNMQGSSEIWTPVGSNPTPWIPRGEGSNGS
jgi:hypothetical protein